MQSDLALLEVERKLAELQGHAMDALEAASQDIKLRLCFAAGGEHVRVEKGSDGATSRVAGDEEGV